MTAERSEATRFKWKQTEEFKKRQEEAAETFWCWTCQRRYFEATRHIHEGHRTSIKMKEMTEELSHNTAPEEEE